MPEWITSIEEKKQGIVIVLDNGLAIWISRGLLQECPFTFRPNTELNTEALSEWLLPRQYGAALSYAIELLARQDRSTGELKQKLNARHYLAETIEMVIFKLRKEHLVNDREFAVNYARNQMQRQIGGFRIRQELRRKALPEDLIEEALSELDDEETEEAAVILAKQLLLRYEKEEHSYRKKEKVMAAMARRGYSYDSASDAYQEAIALLQKEALESEE